MKVRRSLLILYTLLVAAMAYSAAQLGGTTVTAAGVCCSSSAQCEGQLICYGPGTRLACCLNTEMGCKGPGYCEPRREGGGIEAEEPILMP